MRDLGGLMRGGREHLRPSAILTGPFLDGSETALYIAAKGYQAVDARSGLTLCRRVSLDH